MGDEHLEEEVEDPGEVIDEEGPETLDGEEDEADAPDGEEEETDEPEETESGDDTASGEDEASDPVPYGRFSKVYAEKAEAQTKLDLLKKLGTEKYYELYPDERPEEAPAAAAPGPAKIPTRKEAGNLQVTGGEYSGKSLEELYQLDYAAAEDLYQDYVSGIKQQASAQESEQQTVQQELNEFGEARAKEVFGKALNQLDKDQAAQIELLADTVSKWMVETGRGGGLIEDAFFLMNKDGLLEKSNQKALKSLVKTLKGGAPPSVSSRQTASGNGTYGKYMAMSVDELANTFADMTEDQQANFLKKAPKAFREKHPKLPYG
jgi:hypothetical protein